MTTVPPTIMNSSNVFCICSQLRLPRCKGMRCIFRLVDDAFLHIAQLQDTPDIKYIGK